MLNFIFHYHLHTLLPHCRKFISRLPFFIQSIQRHTKPRLTNFYKKRGILLTIICAFIISSCASTTTVKEKPYETLFRESQIQSILIPPVLNNSLNIDASMQTLPLLPVRLAEKGFYVFPVNTVKVVLEQEGLYDPAEIHQLNTTQLASMFGASSVLYVSIVEWTSRYAILATETVVELEFELKNQAGVTLWKTRVKRTHNPDQNNQSDDLFTKLVVSALQAATEKAKPEYMRLANEAAKQAIDHRELPNGPYRCIKSQADTDNYCQRAEMQENGKPAIQKPVTSPTN